MTIAKAIGEAGLLSTSEVAKRLNVDRTTVWLWINQGILKAKRKGVFYGVSPETIKAFKEIYNILPGPKKRAGPNGKKKRSKK